MIYAVRHRTTYSYGSQVGFARCVLRLTPRSSARQTVLASTLAVSPTPRHRVERIGPFAECTTTVEIDTPHKRLVIDAKAQIEVHDETPPNPEPGPDWGDVREATLESRALGPEGPAAYLYPTARTRVVAEITDYVRKSFPARRPIVDAAAELMRRIHDDFAYDPEATHVRTPAAVAFEARRGVCQDFAHIMISGLRGLGLPAGYVSGYLRTIPPPGRARLEGADATHAWVGVWCGPGQGWIGFDPTNAVFARNDHIVLANGRDYADVAPIDGILLAPGKQDLDVEVDVIPQDGSGPARTDATAAGRQRGVGPG